MMYQCLSDILPAPSPAGAENKGHEEAHELIGHEKEDGSDGHHHEDHGGGNSGLASARPRDLLRLRAHFLQEFKWTDLRHMAYLQPSRACGRNPLRFLNFAGRAEPYAWQEWRDSNPQPPVLETGALAIELHSSGSACGGSGITLGSAASAKCLIGAWF